jgi:hypothetical protein
MLQGSKIINVKITSMHTETMLLSSTNLRARKCVSKAKAEFPLAYSRSMEMPHVEKL